MGKKFTFRTPALLSDEVGIRQIEQRLEEGYIPLIKIPGKINEETKKAISELIKNYPQTISIEIGPLKKNQENEEFLQIIHELKQKNPDKIEKYLKSEPNSLSPTLTNSNTGRLGTLVSQYSAEEFLNFTEENFKKITELDDMAEKYGFGLSYENWPRFNYTYLPEKKAKVLIDPHPRWQKKWSGHPAEVGIAFGNVQEILYYMDKAPIKKLSLDMEHFVQTVQWQYIFNLEKGNKVRIGDLPREEQEILSQHGIWLPKHTILWDYETLTDIEQESIEKFGFTLRKGQPFVYKNKTNLVKELDLLLENAGETIKDIAPGFQVWQTFYDGENLMIGSHMPGIQSDIIKDPEKRKEWRAQLGAIYTLIFENIWKNKKEIQIELEPVPYDDKGPAYAGETWLRLMTDTKQQFLELFKKASKQEFDLEKGPLYLK